MNDVAEPADSISPAMLMAKLYSALIFQGHALGAITDVILDPTYLWVVRDIAVFFPGPDSGAALSIIDLTSVATVWHWGDTAVPGDGNSHYWEGRQVFAPPGSGHTLQITTSSLLHAPDVRISGYKLSLP